MTPLSLSIARCPDSMIRGVIEESHYLHRWPDPRSLPFGYRMIYGDSLCASDGRPWGAMVFKKPQHHRQRRLFGYEGLPTSWQILDMARVWVHPDLQAARWMGVDRKGREVSMGLNAFSRMVSLGLKRVQRDWIDHHGVRFPELPYHIELIGSYCDRKHHQGTGYRASGFELWGESLDRTKDLYVRRLKRPRWTYIADQPCLLDALEVFA